MQLVETRNKRTIVNLTPLIDVVFILLIFFMLASSFAEWQFIELAVGEADEMRADSLSTSIVTLKPGETSDISYALNDSAMELNEIISALKLRCETNSDHPIVIQPSEGVALQALVSLLDGINEFAEKNVSLAKIAP